MFLVENTFLGEKSFLVNNNFEWKLFFWKKYFLVNNTILGKNSF